MHIAGRAGLVAGAGVLALIGMGSAVVVDGGGPAAAATSPAKAAFAGTNWQSVSYPGTSDTAACGTYAMTAGQVSYVTVPSGKSEALVLLSCNQSGNPFVSLEAFTPGAKKGEPHYAQTLLNVNTNPWIAGRFSATGTSVSMDAAGYGSPTAASTNVFRKLHWTWRGGRFVSGKSTRITEAAFKANLHVSAT
jgi:hypothetical protein